MNIYLDKPITTIDDDLLGRKAFAKNLAQAIFDNKNLDSYVVGLYGSWGMGKTSVANMALNIIEEMSKSDGNNTVIVKFSPWNYDDKNHLISLLFSALRNEISERHFEKINVKELSKSLREYASICDFGYICPEPKWGIVFTAIKHSLYLMSKVLDSTSTLSAVKKKLEKQLQESRLKIIVFIDDIERLTNSQILDVFQLVKQVGDLPSITYLLSMDKDIVINALTEVHGINGNEYLEKIVQVPFSLPNIHASKLKNLFRSNLESVLDGLNKDISYQEDYLNRVIYMCVYPYICDLRDINRVLNVFEFKCSVMYKDVSLEDLLAICTIEVMNPVFYRWISENKDAVCYGVSKSRISFSGDDELIKNIDSEFNDLGIDKVKAHDFLACIFPEIAKKLPGYYIHPNDSALRMKMSIALPERYDYVFSFDLDSLVIPRGMINECINKYDSIKIKEYLLSLDDDKCKYFLNELCSLLENIPDDRKELFLSCLYDLEFTFDNNSRQIRDSIVRLVDEAINIFIQNLRTKNERIDEYIKICKKDNVEALRFIARNLYNNSVSEIFRNVNKEKENDFRIAFVENVIKLGESINFLNDDKNLYIMLLWESIDNKSYDSYVKARFEESDINKLKYLCSCASEWIGGARIKWQFDRNHYRRFFSDDEAYSIINLLNVEEMKQFSEQERYKLATFAALYESDDKENVDDNEIYAILHEWGDG